MEEPFNLVSTAFHNGGRIPRKHTGDGPPTQKDQSPPLQWNGVPEGTETLALIMEDLDAPEPESPIMPWVHWIVLNIPPHLKGLPADFSTKNLENMSPKERKEWGDIQEGHTDFKLPHYRGPNSPTGVHRYSIRLYALDTHLNLGHKVDKTKLEGGMEGHIIAMAELTGKYSKHDHSTGDFIPPGRPHQAGKGFPDPIMHHTGHHGPRGRN